MFRVVFWGAIVGKVYGVGVQLYGIRGQLVSPTMVRQLELVSPPRRPAQIKQQVMEKWQSASGGRAAAREWWGSMYQRFLRAGLTWRTRREDAGGHRFGGVTLPV